MLESTQVPQTEIWQYENHPCLKIKYFHTIGWISLCVHPLSARYPNSWPHNKYVVRNRGKYIYINLCIYNYLYICPCSPCAPVIIIYICSRSIWIYIKIHIRLIITLKKKPSQNNLINMISNTNNNNKNIAQCILSWASASKCLILSAWFAYKNKASIFMPGKIHQKYSSK